MFVYINNFSELLILGSQNQLAMGECVIVIFPSPNDDCGSGLNDGQEKAENCKWNQI
jgi:hypothetical protein